MTPKVKDPPTSMVAQSIVSQPVVCKPTMSVEEREILGRFLRMDTPRISSTSGDDA